ncbi:hypothetical protein SAMN05421548_101311 [Paraburkholderia lycopersici]|uniref:Uncharacterized protein n=1 Tax=Paraburkholderia lycopersici TaxID=416944 RepID=A0A1G6GTH2_9BURK|nr:hypothetical protein SAMN05421548_101311 [Paraburkholderia lycopersici]
MHVAWASFSLFSSAIALVTAIAAFVTSARFTRSFATVRTVPRRQQASRPLTTILANDKTNEACHVA